MPLDIQSGLPSWRARQPAQTGKVPVRSGANVVTANVTTNGPPAGSGCPESRDSVDSAHNQQNASQPDTHASGLSRHEVTPEEDQALCALGYIAEFRHVRVCNTCGELFEEGAGRRPEPGLPVPSHTREALAGVRLQRTRAPLRLLRTRGVAERQPLGTVLLRRLPHARRGRDALAPASRLIFPVGRHSLMHLWVPGKVPPTLAAHGGDTHALANSVSEATDAVRATPLTLEEWGRIIARRNLERLKLDGEPPLSMYLLELVRRGVANANTCEAAFADMCV